MEEKATAPQTPAKKTRWWLWVLLVVFILLVLGVGTCVGGIYSLFQIASVNVQVDTNQVNTSNTNSTNTSTNVLNLRPVAVAEADITDSQLANALFTSADILDVVALGDVRPSIIEMNHHMDPTPPDTYTFFDGRSWYAIPSGDLRISSAVVKNASSSDAVNFITVRSSGKTMLSEVGGIAEGIGDTALMYYEPANDSSPASVTIRFSRSTLAAKITVYATSDEIKSDVDFQTELTPSVLAVAKAQDARLQDFLANTLPVVEASPSLTSSAVLNLSGTTLVGRIPVTEDEWMGVTGDFATDANISGLADAALSRFLVSDRPEEVVEVTLLDFYVKDIAPEYQSQLINDSNTDKEVELPADIADAADATADENMVESQMVKGNYVIDVSVFSPFGTLDKDAATQDMIKWTQELNSIFNAQ